MVRTGTMATLKRFDLKRIEEIFRFYMAAATNTVFGVGLYFIFVWLGLHIFYAQFFSHILGTIFNYTIYRKHVFRNSGPAKTRFVLSYVANYLVSVAVLAVFATFIRSPYAAGFFTALFVSIGNYVILKRWVFRRSTK